jgi:hypothetical protein
METKDISETLVFSLTLTLPITREDLIHLFVTKLSSHTEINTQFTEKFLENVQSPK